MGGGEGEGDWLCPSCGNTNYSFRTTCNMRKCGAPKPTAQPPAPTGAAGTPGGSRRGADVAVPGAASPPTGSWTCVSCGNVNYPFRTQCNKRSCGAARPQPATDGAKAMDTEAGKEGGAAAATAGAAAAGDAAPGPNLS